MAEGLLEIRLFTVQPGTRDEWHQISHEGTIPLMRDCGINVLAYGPSLNDENGYYLLRLFRDEDERVRLSQSMYATDEWLKRYEEPVTAMMAGYQTAVIPFGALPTR
ncbi:hypothetical protein GCM10029978_075980 [Actinoallomurus acanthiterrae]